MAIHPSTLMVGRDAELAEVAASVGVRPARPAHGLSDLLLSGDAGVGKTRLLRALRDLAVAEGWRVAAGHCLDFGDSALPYLPFSELVGRFAAEQPDVVAAVTAAHPALARLQPGRRVMATRPAEAESAEESGASLDRAELFRGLHALLESIAADRRLLVVVEDCHWADRSTRDLLSYLLARADAGGFALVASYRSDDLHRRHPLRRQVAEWSRLGGVDRIALGPLSDDAVTALIEQLVPGGLPERERRDVVARAEGNAFFVEELVSAAAEQGSVVPADLADLLLVRLDRLQDAARQVVRTASASGRRVTHAMLEATSDLAPEALDEGLRAAVEMNVLVPERGGYAFRHALLGEAVYDDLLPGERVRLHARYVAALRDGSGPGTAAELARHARLALDRSTALLAGVRAGNEASRVGGPDEAAFHYQQALELLTGDPSLADLGVDASKLTVQAADALTAMGDLERAIAVLSEQLELLGPRADAPRRSRLLSALASAIAITESELDPRAVSAEALALAPDGDSRLRARVLANHAKVLFLTGDAAGAQAAGMEALDLAERLDLPDLASDAMTTLGGLKKAGPKEGLRGALEEAVARAAEVEAVHAELRGRFLLGRSYEDWAEWDLAEHWFASALERAEASGLPWAPYGFESRWHLAQLHHLRGEWDRALEVLVVEGPFPPPIPRALLTSARLLIQQGRGADVRARAVGLRPFWRREGAVVLLAAPLEMVVAARAGEPAEALAVYDDAVAVLASNWHEWFSARVRLAAVALGVLADAMPRASAAERQRWLPEAERLIADGRAVLDRIDEAGGFWGPEGRAWGARLEAEALRVRWAAGLAGADGSDGPGAADLVAAWRRAEQAFRAMGHVPETAAVQVALAGLLRATGDAEGARVAAADAREAAERMGAVPLLDRLRVAAPAGGRAASAPAPAAPAAVSLTAREQEILDHVAQGRTNGEIGKVLFISTKTVSVHVSNILAKLGAGSRTEAAAIGRRRGLVRD
ncbi:AAA family ATPase [Nocardioides sp.]|uniref:helix-turn-helix transcriptional regulator n=1 Tax=Nocardioides sp. TaxID=35761 RepID=UPI003511D0D9